MSKSKANLKVVTDPNALQWEEPPARRRQSRVWLGRLQALQARPNQWARLRFKQGGSSISVSNYIRFLRSSYPLIASRCEFVTRTLPDGAALYGRYVGHTVPVRARRRPVAKAAKKR